MIWASKPGCRLPVAEIWLEPDGLWCVVFVDDADRRIKLEIFAPLPQSTVEIVELSDIERLLEDAKRELSFMVDRMDE